MLPLRLTGVSAAIALSGLIAGLGVVLGIVAAAAREKGQRQQQYQSQ